MNTTDSAIPPFSFALVKCRSCDSWVKYDPERAGSQTSCKTCQNKVPVPPITKIAVCRESMFDAEVVRKYKAEGKGFRIICPHCQRTFRMSLSVAEQVVICDQCANPFQAKTFSDKVPDPIVTDGAPVSVSQENTPPAAHRKVICAACHAPIAEGEERQECPDCHLPYHQGCWAENYGCAAYGCAQVECLKPEGPAFRISGEEAAAAGIHQNAAVLSEAANLRPQNLALAEQTGFPWGSLLLFVIVVEVLLLIVEVLLYYGKALEGKPELGLLGCSFVPSLLLINILCRQLLSSPACPQKNIIRGISCTLTAIFWITCVAVCVGGSLLPLWYAMIGSNGWDGFPIFLAIIASALCVMNIVIHYRRS